MHSVLPSPLPRKLNLGCGQFPRPGFLNVDVDAASRADLYLDLSNMEAYRALPEGYFDIIVMDHVLEHLDDVFEVMRAIYRLLAADGRLEIRVPHFSRGITHPEHKHGFDVTFPEYVRPGFRGGYIGVPLALVSMKLRYIIRWDLKLDAGVKPWQVAILKQIDRVISWLANLQPYACSRFWCTWVGGFEQIEFIFQKAPSSST